MPTKKKETTAKPEAKVTTAAKPKKSKSSLDVFIETRLAGIAQVARTRGENQTVDLGDCVVTVFQDGVCKVND